MNKTSELGVYLVTYVLRDSINIAYPQYHYTYLIGSNEDEIRILFDDSKRNDLIKIHGDRCTIGYAGKIERVETPGFKLVPMDDSLEEILDESNSILTNP